MRHITLGNQLLGLDDLLVKRLASLQSFDAGAASVKFLTARRDNIAALPAELTGRPLADELAATDDRHDGVGGATWFVLEAAIRHPDTTPAMLDAAKKIRAAFIPQLEDLRARYDVEAQAATEHEASLVALKTELMMFPVSTGGTLYDWAADFIAAGKKLGAQLSLRADAKDRKAATALRGETLAKLNRLRDDLADAKKDDATLPADLDDQVFGYFDLLEKNDAEAAAEEKKKAAAKKKAPATPPPPTPPTPPQGP
jgi:hypothetical protein